MKSSQLRRAHRGICPFAIQAAHLSSLFGRAVTKKGREARSVLYSISRC